MSGRERLCHFLDALSDPDREVETDTISMDAGELADLFVDWPTLDRGSDVDDTATPLQFVFLPTG